MERSETLDLGYRKVFGHQGRVCNGLYGFGINSVDDDRVGDYVAKAMVFYCENGRIWKRGLVIMMVMVIE